MNIYGPFIVVVPMSTLHGWLREFAIWAPDINIVIYNGDGMSRQIIREYEWYKRDGKRNQLKMNVLLTTFETVLRDKFELKTVKWEFMLVDEAHRLKNQDSQLHEVLKDFHCENKLLITGTPLQNNVKELLSLIRFLMPNRFDDLIEFDINEGDEKSISIHIVQLQERLKNHMLRRLKKDVEKSLPKKTELIVRVPLTEKQKEISTAIVQKNWHFLNKAGTSSTSLLNIAADMKKASNHPYLFPGIEATGLSKQQQLEGIITNSGKMILLDKLLTRLKEESHRVLIFSQSVRTLDIISDYLTLKGHNFQRLDGSTSSDLRKRAMDHFNADGSADFVFLLSTRAGGLGINLTTADTVIIFDSDWNPQNGPFAISRFYLLKCTKTHQHSHRLASYGSRPSDRPKEGSQSLSPHFRRQY